MIFKTKKDDNNLEKKYNDYINGLRSDFDKETAKNLIEKMAVWYELRYPNDTITGFLNINHIKDIDELNDTMFRDNQKFNCEVPNNLNWYDFYNTHTFINSLPEHEQEFFRVKNHTKWSPYTLSVSFTGCGFGQNFYIDKKGYVHFYGDISESINEFSDRKIDVENLEGIPAKKLFNYIEEFNKNNKDMCIDISDWDKEKIKDIIYKMDRKEGFLDSVMYKILDRRYKGVSYIGAYRAFLFAKEFKRDINIPMKYAFDREYGDSEINNFVREFIKDGGSQDLICCYDDNSKEFPLSKIIKKVNRIDEEERQEKQEQYEKEKLEELRERFVNALLTKIENTASTDEKKTISKIEKQRVKTRFENK